MRTLITLLMLSALLLLSGCATTGEVAFYARQEAAESARAARMAALADTSACNGDATCVVAAKGFAAMAELGGGEAGRVQQYVAPVSPWERWADRFLGLGQHYYNYRLQARISDNSVRRDEAQFGFLGGVVRDSNATSARSAEAAFGVLPQLGPRIDVGGDYVPGQVGDNAGRDIVRDGSQVGHNTGAINTGTQIENDGNFGDGNRQDSPDDRSQRTECEGDGCMGVNRPITNPLPEPEEGE